VRIHGAFSGRPEYPREADGPIRCIIEPFALRQVAVAETLTITLPDSPKKRDQILRYLQEQGLVEIILETPQTKSKWARLAETMAEQAYMDGKLGVQVLKSVQEFRDDFEIPDPL